MAVGPEVLNSAVGKLADTLEARVDKHLRDTLRTKGTLGLTPDEAALLPESTEGVSEALILKYREAGWLMASFRIKRVNDCSSTQTYLEYALTPPTKPAPPLTPLKKARERVEANLQASLAQLGKATGDPCGGGGVRTRC